MIALHHVAKVYPTRSGPRTVLQDITMTLAMGERLGVLGRNGAGKSTLVRLISGAEQPTAGTISRRMSVSWPLAFTGAFQPQLTGVDNVRFISKLYQQDIDRNLAFVEDFAELGAYLREPVRTYSSGMRARLAFAISMIIEFDCFLIDEIAAVGDARFHERCNYELFDRRGDRAMVIISHDPGYLRDHCNRWAVLDAGQLTLFADFEEAHDHFMARFGVADALRAATRPFARRLPAIESLRRVAHADERFMALVRVADTARDQHDWPAAEARYAEALALHPFERSYWVQFGHVARESGKLMRAEIAYRTACALGEPARMLEPFITAVAAVLGAAGTPAIAVPDSGATRHQPAGYPDLAVITTLASGASSIAEETALTMLRQGISIEAALAQISRDAAPGGTVAWPGAIAMVPGDAPPRRDWVGDLARLTGAQDGALAAALARGVPGIAALRSAGGLTDWNLDDARADREAAV